MTSALQEAMPAYDFNEVHRREIAAPPEPVWDALGSVRLDQLRITRPLVALRHLGGEQPPSGPLLGEGPVTIFDRDAPTYAIGGFVGRPWRRSAPRLPVDSLDGVTGFDEPGWVKVLTDFAIVPTAAGCRIETETRILATDPGARRRFTLYWAAIRIGSGLIRRDLLATIDRLATRT